MEKRNITFLVLTLLAFSLISNASAITGRLGNSRMILNLDEGETAERYVLVQNHNDVALTIELAASGDLADSITLSEESFVLQPGEEKKAYFTIKAAKGGTTESKINVRFTPEEGTGVGLTSTIIVVAPGENTEDDEDNSDAEIEINETDSNSTGFNFNIGNNPSLEENEGNSVKTSPLTILLIVTVLLILAFIILIIYASRKSKVVVKKGLRRPSV